MPYRSGEGDWLTINQAAELLRVSPSTLRRWERDGHLREVRRTPGGWRLYDRKTVLALGRSVRGVTVVEDEEHR